MIKLTKANITKGMKLKMKTNNYKSCGLDKGTPIEVFGFSGNNIIVDHINYKGLIVPISELDWLTLSKKIIEQEIADCKASIAENESKLKWMKDTKSEIFDESEFKVWQVLSALDSKSSKIEKTRAIAKLIKGD